MTEQKPSNRVKIIAWTEILLGMVGLLFWGFVLVGDATTGSAWGFGIEVGLLNSPVFILILVSGLLTLKLKKIGLHLNILLFILLLVLLVAAQVYGVPTAYVNVDGLPFDIDLSLVFFIPLLLAIGYLLTNSQMKKEFKN